MSLRHFANIGCVFIPEGFPGSKLIPKPKLFLEEEVSFYSGEELIKLWGELWEVTSGWAVGFFPDSYFLRILRKQKSYFRNPSVYGLISPSRAMCSDI